MRPESEERAYVALASRGELTARVVGAMWWERQRGAEQIEEFVERRRTTSIGRYRATSVKLMMDGVLENFTGAMLEPYGDGRGGTTGQPGTQPDRPGRPQDLGPTARCARFPAALPRHRRPGGARIARRGGSRSRREWRVRHPPAHRPHPGHPSRTTSVGSGSSASWPTPSPTGPATKADGQPHDPVPGRPLALAVSVPFPARRRCGARDGLGLERIDAEPAPGDGASGRARRRRRVVASASRSCPTSGWTSSMRSRRSRPGRRT